VFSISVVSRCLDPRCPIHQESKETGHHLQFGRVRVWGVCVCACVCAQVYRDSCVCTQVC
jgi:hypothetical protein